MSTSSPRVDKTKEGLAFIGVIDHQSVPDLIKEMPDASESVLAEKVLDLSAVSKIDSAGVALLIHWGNRNLEPGQKITLRGASLQLRQLIDIMRLRSIFELLA